MTDEVRNVFKGRVLTLNLETVTLPNGRVAELEIAHHPGGAGVVAIDDAGRVCLLRQYRHAAGGWLTEIPAGKLHGGEPPLECARRELAEEGGVSARRWDKLGDYLSSPRRADRSHPRLPRPGTRRHRRKHTGKTWDAICGIFS